jgi:hypothetical protein
VNSVPTADDLETLWSELDSGRAATPAGRRVRRVLPDSTHHCFVGVDYPAACRVFSVVAPDVPANAANGLLATAGITITAGAPAGHGTTLDVVLRASSHSDIFTALVADLLVVLAHTTGGPGRAVVDRLGEWQRMLASVSPEGLSPERQRGLFGELHTLSELLLPAFGSSAVFAWTGPDRELQDFQFGTGSIEVKTAAGHDPSNVRISSERQLDDVGPGALFLVTLALDARQGGRGLSLPEIVARVRRQATELGVATELDQRLVRAGYLDTQSHRYLDRRYGVRQRHVHHVRDGFPRITERTRPAGLTSIAYSLDLLAAAAFILTPAEMITMLEMTE